ncbi:hypothetical protein [Sediminibacterium ginsengisoli]|uniref:Uncharacterized protein n=1 Tax=Sediminibacterium ginsengisoli TaxID=413434 RepID=A0A1T4PT61_9BACT|nr:hypothetical protein [Sediminibacterium ginsengisoli]SJZ94745.1 hypothetical protein SAMN04488132_106206 [Sediminibacterium ginsengisoli]SKA20891.1 hypothetical protein SAMN04488132_11640 [Sediminibacterium ginsengisoli]
MKFLLKMGGFLRKAMIFGVVLGAVNAGFKAAHDYYEGHAPADAKPEVKND